MTDLTDSKLFHLNLLLSFYEHCNLTTVSKNTYVTGFLGSFQTPNPHGPHYNKYVTYLTTYVGLLSESWNLCSGNLLGVRVDPTYSKTKVFFHIRMKVKWWNFGIFCDNLQESNKVRISRRTHEYPCTPSSTSRYYTTWKMCGFPNHPCNTVCCFYVGQQLVQASVFCR